LTKLAASAGDVVLADFAAIGGDPDHEVISNYSLDYFDTRGRLAYGFAQSKVEIGNSG
jgi:hypothetical protein